MSTESLVTSFREDAISSSLKLIEFAGPQLKSLVDSSETVFRQCYEVSQNPKFEDLPSLALFRHIIEMADAVEVLLCAGTGGPMIPVIRSMFEAYLSLGYIMEKDYERRSLAWVYSYVCSELERAKRLAGQGKKGQESKEMFEAQWEWLPDSFRNTERTAAEIEELQELTQHSRFEALAKEYRKQKQPFPAWYALCGTKFARGKNARVGLKDLANHLKFGPFYELYYGPWSGVTHATDMSRHVAEQADGTLDFGPLRSLDNLPRNLYYTFVFLWGAACLMLERFFQRQDFTKSNEDMLYIYKRLKNFKQAPISTSSRPG